MLYAAVRWRRCRRDGVGIDAARPMPGVLKVVDFSHALAEFSGAGAGVAVVAKPGGRRSRPRPRWRCAGIGAACGLVERGDVRGSSRALDTESGFTSISNRAARKRAGHARAGGRIPRALPGARRDGADQLHRPVQGWQAALWASTQVPSVAVDIAAKVAGVGRADVRIDTMLLGGGFGRRLETDMVAQAVAVALQADGQPVQLIWTREDDITTTSTGRGAGALQRPPRRGGARAGLGQQIGRRRDRPPVLPAQPRPAGHRAGQDGGRGRVRHAVRSRTGASPT
jgi:isoquinoline 1-oxidoreductase beta subunit